VSHHEKETAGTQAGKTGHGQNVRISVFVAQVSNLPYRGFPIRTRSLRPEPADWKSALQTARAQKLRCAGTKVMIS